MTTKHRQPKNHSLTVSPFLILPQLLLPPPPPPPYAMLIWEVMLARKLFMTQKTTLSWGGGGGVEAKGNVMVCLFTVKRTWKGNFVIDFVHVGLVGFPNVQ